MKKRISLILAYLACLLPINAFAYVTPAFPVHQAFPVPQHPTPVSLEEGQILITMQGDKTMVVSQLELIAPFVTTISLEMSCREIRNLSMQANKAVLTIQEKNSSSQETCTYQTNVKLPAQTPVKLISRYQLKGHAGDSGNSLYGDTLLRPTGKSADEQVLATIPQHMNTYALTLKGLNRWKKAPDKLRIIIRGQELIRSIRDLSPSAWQGDNEHLTWIWNSEVSPMPPADIAWQTVSGVASAQEEAIYRRLTAKNGLGENTRRRHILALKRFNGQKKQYFQELEAEIKAGEKVTGSQTAPGDLRIYWIPELIATKIQLSGRDASTGLAKHYLQILDSLQETLLLDGQDPGATDEAINIIKQLLAEPPIFSEIN